MEPMEHFTAHTTQCKVKQVTKVDIGIANNKTQDLCELLLELGEAAGQVRLLPGQPQVPLLHLVLAPDWSMVTTILSCDWLPLTS